VPAEAAVHTEEVTVPDPDLTPAQERAVRDLLAHARHDEPVPDDVAARLDATLDELHAERDRQRPTERPTAPVVPLSRAARRRRLAGGALVAAAAVVVAGVGIGQVVDVTGSGSGEDASSVADEAAGGSSEREPSQEIGPDEGGEAFARGSAATLRPDTFRKDVRRLAPVSALARPRPRVPGCEVRGAGRGTWVPVTYDDQEGVLVYRRPRKGAQRVDLYLCGADSIARSVVLRDR
jgi:hypothetical protein